MWTYGMDFNALIMPMLVGKFCSDYLKGLGAKDIPFANNFDGLATVYQNTPDFWHNPATWLCSVVITVQDTDT